MNKKSLFLLIIIVLMQTFVIIAQPKIMHAVLTAPIYNFDDNTGIGPLPGEQWSALMMQEGLVEGQAWNINNINKITSTNATKQNIRDAVIAMPKQTNNMNFFFFGGHGTSNGIYTHNALINRYWSNNRWWQETNIEWISPAELQSYFGSFNTYCAFIEACYSGVFAEQMTTGIVCTSSSSNQISAGNLGSGAGYFAQKLKHGMQFANFPIGSLTAQALFNYAAPLTASEALTYSGIIQTPQMTDNYGSPLLITTPAFNITFENNFVGLPNQGTMTIDGQPTTLPTNALRKYYGASIQLVAQNQTINNIEYTFSHWENNSTSAYRTVSVNDAANIKANFIGKPSNYVENIRFTNTEFGQNISLAWTDNPNLSVDRYQIWRKVKHNGVLGAAAKIDSVGRNIQSWTDPLYVTTNGYTDDLIFYDVRARYSIESTYSDPDYQNSTFGAVEYARNNNENYSTYNEIPLVYSISNHPNPFNPTTVINYQLPAEGFVTIKVYDMLGKEVVELVNENKAAGFYRVNFDASKLASGIYIYSINAGSFNMSKKMILTK